MLYKTVINNGEALKRPVTMRWSVWVSIVSVALGVAVASEDLTLPFALEVANGKVRFYEDTSSVNYVIEKNDGNSLRSSIAITGSTSASRVAPRLASSDDCDENATCIDFEDGIVRVVVDTNPVSRSAHIFVNTTTNNTAAIITCFELGDDRWFGGPEAKYQLWPVEEAVWNYTEYVPKEDEAVAIAEAYWLSSTGKSIYVSPTTPLFFDQNTITNGSLCFGAEIKSPYRNREYVTMQVNVSYWDDPRTAHEELVAKAFTKPTGIPDERMIAQPVWSSWARYKANVSESRIRQYASEILANSFTNSQIEIDDFWETCYGSLTFSTNEDKFPDIKNLTDDLHNLGFRVTLWVHPFINADCTEYYQEAYSNGYLGKDENGSVYTVWWQGKENASVIDFTNEAAVEWFTSRLWALKNSSGIDSFKFDAGETSWLPEPADLTGDPYLLPGLYTSAFARALAQFGTGIEVRVGWQTQDLPIFVRMLDKDTDWTFNNGLPTLITTLLVMNLAGYGYVLPDMVGGNGYLNGELTGTVYPDRELFIRWLQANTFMPTIQYSFVPWDYDNETVEICRRFTELHETYAPTIIEVMQTAVSDLAPVNPPVWWLDPTNSDAHGINDEYLLGEVILVAPVVVEGAVTRDIFLPTGTWREEAYDTHTIYEGPTWIYDYPAPLEILPYFTKINSTESSAVFHATPSLLAIGILSLVSLITKLSY